MIYLEGYRSTNQNILFRPGAGYKINTTLEKLPDGEQNAPRPEAVAERSCAERAGVPAEPSRCGS